MELMEVCIKDFFFLFFSKATFPFLDLWAEVGLAGHIIPRVFFPTEFAMMAFYDGLGLIRCCGTGIFNGSTVCYRLYNSTR